MESPRPQKRRRLSRNPFVDDMAHDSGDESASDSDSVSGRARAGKGWKGWMENGRAWLVLINKINYKFHLDTLIV